MPASEYIECPFCQGLLESKTGKQTCPDCGTNLEIDDRMVSERSAWQAGALNQLSEAEAELAQMLVRLPALESRLTRAVLTAPAFFKAGPAPHR